MYIKDSNTRDSINMRLYSMRSKFTAHLTLFSRSVIQNSVTCYQTDALISFKCWNIFSPVGFGMANRLIKQLAMKTPKGLKIKFRDLHIRHQTEPTVRVTLVSLVYSAERISKIHTIKQYLTADFLSMMYRRKEIGLLLGGNRTSDCFEVITVEVLNKYLFWDIRLCRRVSGWVTS
jgi:hypothetical protein